MICSGTIINAMKNRKIGAVGYFACVQFDRRVGGLDTSARNRRFCSRAQFAVVRREDGTWAGTKRDREHVFVSLLFSFLIDELSEDTWFSIHAQLFSYGLLQSYTFFYLPVMYDTAMEPWMYDVVSASLVQNVSVAFFFCHFLFFFNIFPLVSFLLNSKINSSFEKRISCMYL